MGGNGKPSFDPKLFLSKVAGVFRPGCTSPWRIRSRAPCPRSRPASRVTSSTSCWRSRLPVFLLIWRKPIRSPPLTRGMDGYRT